MNFETIQFPNEVKVSAGKGSTGLRSQLPGVATTVSALAMATGGMKGGSLFIKQNNNK
jgi:hypothetical protein